MHHGQQPMGQPRLNDLETDIAKLNLGATGRFPEGQLDPTDEGEVRIGITVKDGKVLLAFGKPIAWLGFTDNQAIQFARKLEQTAKRLPGGAAAKK